VLRVECTKCARKGRYSGAGRVISAAMAAAALRAKKKPGAEDGAAMARDHRKVSFRLVAPRSLLIRDELRRRAQAIRSEWLMSPSYVAAWSRETRD
jgi:hypothetical protein